MTKHVECIYCMPSALCIRSGKTSLHASPTREVGFLAYCFTAGFWEFLTYSIYDSLFGHLVLNVPSKLQLDFSPSSCSCSHSESNLPSLMTLQVSWVDGRPLSCIPNPHGFLRGRMDPSDNKARTWRFSSCAIFIFEVLLVVSSELTFITTPLSDLYVYAVLVCCVGILSVLLFTLVIAWQSVFHKRKSRGKKTDKVMSGMESHPPTHGLKMPGKVSPWREGILGQRLFTWSQRTRGMRRLASCRCCWDKLTTVTPANFPFLSLLPSGGFGLVNHDHGLHPKPAVAGAAWHCIWAQRVTLGAKVLNQGACRYLLGRQVRPGMSLCSFPVQSPWFPGGCPQSSLSLCFLSQTLQSVTPISSWMLLTLVAANVSYRAYFPKSSSSKNLPSYLSLFCSPKMAQWAFFQGVSWSLWACLTSSFFFFFMV